MNTFSGLVHTARHVTKVGNTRSPWPNRFAGGVVEGGTRSRRPNRKGGGAEGVEGEGGEVVTR